MIHKKIKDFLNKKINDKKEEKEKLIKSILDMAKEDEKETFKKFELENLSIGELKKLKKDLENS